MVLSAGKNDKLCTGRFYGRFSRYGIHSSLHGRGRKFIGNILYDCLLYTSEGNKFFLDSKEPKQEEYQAFLDGEVRYNALKRANPEKAAKLFSQNEKEAMERYAYLKKLVTLYGEE